MNRAWIRTIKGPTPERYFSYRHVAAIRSLAGSTDGKMVYFGDESGKVLGWQPLEQREPRHLFDIDTRTRQPVTHLALSGSLLAVGTLDGQLWWWNPSSSTPCRLWDGKRPDRLVFLEWLPSPSNALVAVWRGGDLAVFQGDPPMLSRKVSWKDRTILAANHRGGEMVLTAADGRIGVWRLDQEDDNVSYLPTEGVPPLFSVNSVGSLILGTAGQDCGPLDGAGKRILACSADVLAVGPGQGNSPVAIGTSGFTPERDANSRSDSVVTVWKIDELGHGPATRTWRSPAPAPIVALAWLPGERLAIATGDGHVHLWRPFRDPTGRWARRLLGLDRRASHLLAVPEGRGVVTAANRNLTWWVPPNGQFIECGVDAQVGVRQGCARVPEAVGRIESGHPLAQNPAEEGRTLTRETDQTALTFPGEEGLRVLVTKNGTLQFMGSRLSTPLTYRVSEAIDSLTPLPDLTVRVVLEVGDPLLLQVVFEGAIEDHKGEINRDDGVVPLLSNAVGESSAPLLENPPPELAKPLRRGLILFADHKTASTGEVNGQRRRPRRVFVAVAFALAASLLMVVSAGIGWLASRKGQRGEVLLAEARPRAGAERGGPGSAKAILGTDNVYRIPSEGDFIVEMRSPRPGFATIILFGEGSPPEVFGGAVQLQPFVTASSPALPLAGRTMVVVLVTAAPAAEQVKSILGRDPVPPPERGDKVQEMNRSLQDKSHNWLAIDEFIVEPLKRR